MPFKYSNWKRTSFNCNLVILQYPCPSRNISGVNWILRLPLAGLDFYLFWQLRKTLNLFWKKKLGYARIRFRTFSHRIRGDEISHTGSIVYSKNEFNENFNIICSGKNLGRDGFISSFSAWLVEIGGPPPPKTRQDGWKFP